MSYEYIRPKTLEEALNLLSEDAQAEVYAGGTDLLWEIRAQAVTPDMLVDLKGLEELSYIHVEDDCIKIGAMTSLREIETAGVINEKAAAVAQAAGTVASQKLRNLATIGGNLCQRVKCPWYNQSHINLYMRESIDPCFKRGGKVCHAAVNGSDCRHTIIGKGACKAPVASDLSIALAAMDAKVEITSLTGTRVESVRTLYKAGETDLKQGEIMTAVTIPVYPEGRSMFDCYMPYPGSFSYVSVAVSRMSKADDVSIYVGGVSQIPYAADEVTEVLMSGSGDSELIDRACVELLSNVKITNDEVLFKVAKARDMCRDALKMMFDQGVGK